MYVELSSTAPQSSSDGQYEAKWVGEGISFGVASGEKLNRIARHFTEFPTCIQRYKHSAKGGWSRDIGGKNKTT